MICPPDASDALECAAEFVQFAQSRAIDLSGLCVAERKGELVAAVLPVVSPGRTALLLSVALPPAKSVAPLRVNRLGVPVPF